MKTPCSAHVKVGDRGGAGVLYKKCHVPARWLVWLATEPYDDATMPGTAVCGGHLLLYQDLKLLRDEFATYIGQHRSPTTLTVTAAWGRSIRADGYQPRHAKVVA